MKNYPFMILFFSIALVLYAVSVVHIEMGKDIIDIEQEEGEPVNPESGRPIPKNITEAIERLDEILDKETKQKIVYYSEVDLTTLSQYEYMFEYKTYGHMGIGASLRYGWGLWENSRLMRWFRWRGINHPDDASGAILDQYTKHLKGAPVTSFVLARILIILVPALIISLVISGFCWLVGFIRKRIRQRKDRSPREVVCS